MPGYYVHFATCGGESLRNRSFAIGVEAPDLLKAHSKSCICTTAARKKYDTLRTADMPIYTLLLPRILQKETPGTDDGPHYGMSSHPNVAKYWRSLSEDEQQNPFYRGYAWHLLGDLVVYSQMHIDEKFRAFQRQHAGDPDFESLRQQEVKKLHADWDKTNSLLRDTYPDITLPAEVLELGVVQFAPIGDLSYIDWPSLQQTIDFLRSFDPLTCDMEATLQAVTASLAS